MTQRALFVAFAIGWLAILAPVGAQADPIISVGSFPLAPVPSYLPSPPAGAFYVPVEISGAANLQNWQFSLNFDNTVVEVVDPGDGSSGIYGAEFTPGDVNSQSFILSGFPFNALGLVDTVAGSYPLLPNGPSGDGVSADILFQFLPGQDGNNPNFSITNTGVVQVPVPAPEAGSFGLLVALALLAGFFAVNRVKGRSLFAVASAIAILASGSVSAQTSMNGPYYANPSWDQSLPVAQRFIVLSNMNNETVLDRETGLVWERQPVTDTVNWIIAGEQCRKHLIGHRRGWRLPSYEELLSLLDDTQSSPALPAGHPFLSIGATDLFWTATQVAGESDSVWIVEIAAADTWLTAPNSGNAVTARFWCVRGGSGQDFQ